MSNEEMSPLLRKATEIMENAKANSEDGWISEEEYNRVCAELSKLGITVLPDCGHEPPAVNKQVLVTDVQIHPWSKGRNGNFFNPWCVYEEGAEDAGWNVHSFALNGQGGGVLIDDDDFDDYQSALAHGEALAKKYGVPLRERRLFMVG